VASFLPEFPAGVDIVNQAGYAPLVVTMPNGDALAEAVAARASGTDASA
jgi:hypothetical protein